MCRRVRPQAARLTSCKLLRTSHTALAPSQVGPGHRWIHKSQGLALKSDQFSSRTCTVMQIQENEISMKNDVTREYHIKEHY